ncbi:hypothetical protein QCA50_013335 [Cerrena zonata]|uniref:C2H2-type domain-containing protein n=1 Tax=Cerrena zonata TaxID=2478898 RepID=A0AAW0FRN0_9APHY
MEKINLNEYFEGISTNRTCPSELCAHASGTNVEFRDHLWTHKETEAGRPISKQERLNRCPHPDCNPTATHSSISKHMNSHTGRKSLVCPHLVSWEPHHERELCGYSTMHSDKLQAHRYIQHGFDQEAPTSIDPWVEWASVALSDAELHFDGPVEEYGNEDNINAPHFHPNLNPPPAVGAQGNAPTAAGPQVHSANAPLPYAPPTGVHFALGGRQLHLKRVEITRFAHIPHPLGHIVTKIEKLTYLCI